MITSRLPSPIGGKLHGRERRRVDREDAELALEVRQLLVGRLEAGDLSAEDGRDLDHVHAYSSGGGDDGYPVTRSDPGTAGDVERCGHCVGYRCREGCVEVLGQGNGIAVRQDAYLAVAAVLMDADVAGQRFAERLLAGEAAATPAAEEIEVRHHALAEAVGCDVGTHLDDSADELVARDPRKIFPVVAQIAADRVQDGQADRAGLDLDQDLVVTRARLVDTSSRRSGPSHSWMRMALN